MKKLAKIALVGSLSCFMAFPVLADLDDGLVAHYPFDGNANDASGNGNHGTVSGATLTEDRFGNIDSAYEFDGSNDYINIGHDDILDIGVGNATLQAWIKFSEQQSQTWQTEHLGSIVGKGFLGSYIGHGLYVDNDTVCYQVRMPKDFKYYACSDNYLNDGNWHHIAGILKRDEVEGVKLYVDGVLQTMRGLSFNIASQPTADVTESTETLDNGNSFTIGASSKINYYNFNGLIDDIHFYKRALSNCEIKSLYTGEEECNEPPVGCADEPATYSNETRQAILPCLEIPLYTDINGSPINITGLYSAVLEIPFGFSDFEAKELTFLEIIEESNPTHARFNPDSGILDIPRMDVPTTVPLLVGGTVPGPTLQCSAELQQSALRAEVLMLQKFDCNLP